MDLQSVLAGLDELCDVYPEGIVAVGPEPGFLAVHIDGRFGHSAVEQQFGMPLEAFGNLERALIVALAYPGQRTAAPAFLGGLFLAVLFDTHRL